MVLENNDATVGGVYVANKTPNSPAGKVSGMYMCSCIDGVYALVVQMVCMCVGV